MPFLDQEKYKIFPWGKTYYIVNNECRKKLHTLDTYRDFFFSYKPVILIPILIVAFLLNLPFIFMDGIEAFDSKHIRRNLIISVLVLYILSIVIYVMAIKRAINCNGGATRWKEKREKHK